ncbi:two-component regulator propeller domain-containing protein [Dokdonella sp. MW10]|uniref:hybrid sensor histidine kinase/response regulator n=1 Tax=Dokdonella sp. MW10 TaxID=2992926 RepID=UPI003F80A6BB
MSSRIGLILACTLAAACVQAELPPAPPLFESLRVADGLPSSVVAAIEQGPDGFVWIGTRDGLARYDGLGFRVWQHDPRDLHSLAGNDVSALAIDARGRVWCGGEAAGVNLLLPDGRFRRFRHAAADPHSLGSDDVFALAVDPDDTVWAGTYLGGLNRLHEDGRVERVVHDPDDPSSLRSDVILALRADGRGRLWIGTDQGLDVRLGDGRIVHVALPPFERAGPRGLLVSSLLDEPDGTMLVGTSLGIARVDASLAFAGEVFDSSGLVVRAMMRDAAGGLWAGTSGGVVHVDGEGEHRYDSSEFIPGEMPGTQVADILRDHEGGMWFAFADGGIARLGAHWRNFAAWRHRPGQDDSLRHARIRGVALDHEGNVWATSGRDGLDRIDAGSGEVERWGSRLGVRGYVVRAVLPRDRHVWIGHQAGLRRYALDGGDTVELDVDAARPDALPVGYVGILAEAPDGVVWAVVVGGGVARIDAATLGVRRYTPREGTLRSSDLGALRLDARGVPWVAGGAGLQRHDALLDRFDDVRGGPPGPVDTSAFAADGSLWLHRLGVLERYRMEEGVLVLDDRLDGDDGWPAMRVTDLVVARDDSVWIGGGRGLWRFDPRTRELRRFAERDGLPGSELLDGPFAVGPGGEVYAATLNGVVAFDPATMRFDAPPPPLHLVGVSVRRDGERVELDPAVPAVLRHDDRDLTVVVRALSFVNARGNRYRFRLDEFDGDWVDAGTRGERVFPLLPAGSHVLRVRAANADGIWSEMGATYAVRVRPAPWRTPWAYVGYAAIGFVFVLAMVAVWRARIARRHELELADQQRRSAERLAEVKSDFLAMMSHEIRTPMTGMLGMTELLRETPLDARQQRQVDAIARSGELLMRLVNDGLDLVRIEAGRLALEERPFDPVALLREVVALQEPIAERKRLVLSTSIADDMPACVRGDAMRVKQVMLNLVGNALKFTEHGGVDVRLARGDGLRIHVADTGPGMGEAMRARLFGRFEQSDGVLQRHGGSGLGLSICRQLAELMGGRIDVDSRIGEGTRFTVDLPLQAIDAPPDATPQGVDEVPSARHRALRVLVVEDDPIVAAVVTGMLEASGHRATHVPHALAALAETSRRDDLDVALVDLDLPGIDGLQLARLLRNRERIDGPQLPLVAVTARSGVDEHADVRAAGMDLLLRKPLTRAALEAALDAVLAR